MGYGPHSSKFVICVVLLLFVLFYVLFVFVMFYVLFVFVMFYVLFVCKCVLYYCHRLTIQLQLINISYHIISYKTVVVFAKNRSRVQALQNPEVHLANYKNCRTEQPNMIHFFLCIW